MVVSRKGSDQDEGSTFSLGDGDQDVFARLRALHDEDRASFGNTEKGHFRHATRPFYLELLGIAEAYTSYVVFTWSKAAWHMIFDPLTIMDIIAILVLSSGSCLIMAAIVIWCTLAKLPVAVELFSRWSAKATGGLSLVNAFSPSVFNESSELQLSYARAALVKFSQAQRGHKSELAPPRIFDLDVAKLLFQCAALMYERTSCSKKRCAGENNDPNTVADREENTIENMAALRLGLQYKTVSVLNSGGTSFCGLFWDPDSTFIIAAYKGTTPTDPQEWISDFSFHPRSAGQWIKGFGLVHGGFLDKLFPPEVTPHSHMPYDIIRESINAVADELLIGKPEGTKIHLWTTGHSLGCALASLVYAKTIMEDDVREEVIMRDAYLFAAPIMCDAQSAAAFNHQMNCRSDTPRTMWRFTNGNDAVATMLPHQGDTPDWNFSPFNILTFAHLGCEVKLRTSPEPCLVTGNLLTKGTVILATSSSGTHKVTPSGEQKKMLMLQRIPLIGPLLCHGTGFYWAQLQSVSPGACVWKK